MGGDEKWRWGEKGDGVRQGREGVIRWNEKGVQDNDWGEVEVVVYSVFRRKAKAGFSQAENERVFKSQGFIG